MSILLEPLPKSSRKLRFGLFEADLVTGELWKSGIRIRVQTQPFQILALLLKKPGQVVTREEIEQEIWGSDTIVDFDRSIASAINKLREALGDSAYNPRFIETVSRRGYRFLAPVAPVQEEDHTASKSTTLASATDIVATTLSSAAPPPPQRIFWLFPGIRAVVTGLALLFITSSVYLIGWRNGRKPPIPPRIRQIIFSGRVLPGDPLFDLGATATDGSRLYFSEIEHGSIMLAQTLIADGETGTIPLPNNVVAPSVCAISPDGANLLLLDRFTANAEQPLWIVPTIGGGGRRIPGILAHDATWMPDGQRILYANGNSLYIAQQHGIGIQKFATLPGSAFWLRWSPDDHSLRFTLLNSETHSSHLWTIGANGSDPHPLLPVFSSDECCGSWTGSGSDFVFQRTSQGSSNIWVIPEHGGWFDRQGKPYQITNGPLNYEAPITAPSGRKIFFIGLDLRSELLQFDASSQLFVPYTGGISNASHPVAFSRDGQWVAWIRQDNGSLWRSRTNGSERLQLTSKPFQIFMMQWSPDNRRLLLMARELQKNWAIYIIDTDGGGLRRVYPEHLSQADPDWSPDGKSIVFGRLQSLMPEASMSKAIYMLNLATHKLTKLPGSEGLFSPRWSANGRYIAALSIDQFHLMLDDLQTKTWRTLALKSVAEPIWGHEDHYIYFEDFIQSSEPLYRVNIRTGNIQRIAELRDVRTGDAVNYSFAGLTPNNVPLVVARTSTANLYTLLLPRY
jgi:Tol biopolymer transport system component/DNA-binding winged helix-turn-helix (wHTH) protein